ncbi:hypothetical protein DY000_02015948 [Brassica cretica]|uniref:Uncharacterized protein n=1 Tax=Brassica cretica TaxID=69181 RepID=A0ABQ7CX13_BRACR|nr:hypothetical protein DY000_02015948 [Brassica cretica]
MKLDGVYYPLNESISWLTTCMEEMKQDIARIQNATDAARPPSIDKRQPQSIDSHHSPSIDIHHHTSIDNHFAASIDVNPPRPHTMKSQPDFHTREEIDQLVEGIYRALETTKERLDGRCDDIYFPMDLTISELTSKEPKLTSNTKPDTTACLGAWYTWDLILQTSLEDGRTIPVHTKDIKRLLKRASRDEPAYICLPEHASSFTQTKLVPEIYTKDEINEMFYGVCGEHERNKEAFQMKLDGVYYPLNDSISWLTTCMEEMKQNIARIQNATDAARPPSIDRRQPQSIDSRHSPSIDRHHHTSIDHRFAASIDINPPRTHTMKSQPDFHTREEIDQLLEGIYRALENTEERLDGRCDDIYFPMDLTISALTSKVEAIQGELVEIQSYIARRLEASISIDRHNNKSIDTNHPTSIDSDTNRGRLVPKTTSDTSNTPYHEKEITADFNAALTKNQFNLESLGQRLQRIENTTAAMKDKWRREDEAMRDFTGTWFNKRKEEMDTCFPTSPNSPHY